MNTDTIHSITFHPVTGGTHNGRIIAKIRGVNYLGYHFEELIIMATPTLGHSYTWISASQMGEAFNILADDYKYLRPHFLKKVAAFLGM